MIPGQYAVANVTMNRAGHKSRICEVVTAAHQFSWTRNALLKQGDRYVLKAKFYPKDQQAWQLAKHIAGYAIKHRITDFTRGATHYHTINVDPHWRRSMEKTKRMGKHVFYRVASKSPMTGNA